MSCPEPKVIVAWLSTGLSEEERGAIELHVDECSSCRRLLAALVKGDTADGAPSDEPVELTPGDQQVPRRSMS